MRNQVLSTSRYVDNVTPLAKDPAVVQAAATNATTQLFAAIDVQDRLEKALPKRAKFLAAPITVGVRTFVEEAAVKAIESDQFQTIWIRANKLAHTQVQDALTGGGPVLSTRHGKVTLDLTPVILRIRKILDDRGITIFDSIPIARLALRFELFDAKQLDQAQTGVDLLNKLAWTLPFFSLGLLGVGLWLSPHRRRSLERWGIGTAIAVAVLGVSLTIGRSFYLDAVASPSLPRDAAAAVFDVLLRFLRDGVRVMFVIALIVALTAWITGPGKVAERVRSTFLRLFGRLGDEAEGHGVDFGRFGRFVAQYRGPVRIGGIVVALLIAMLSGRPSVGEILLLVVLLLVYLGAVEFVVHAAPGDADATVS